MFSCTTVNGRTGGVHRRDITTDCDSFVDFNRAAGDRLRRLAFPCAVQTAFPAYQSFSYEMYELNKSIVKSGNPKTASRFDTQ